MNEFRFDTVPRSDMYKTYIRDGIYNETWYPRLVVLWYGLALAFGCDLLLVFPYWGAPTNPELLNHGFTVPYISWLALDVGLLWIPTMFLIDPITQYFWLQTWIGRKLSDRPWSTIAWGLLIIVIMFVSLGFDALCYYNPAL